MSEIVSPSLMQLLAQAPVILVYLVGITLSLLLRRRGPLPCTFALCGFLLLLVLSLVQPFVVQYLIRSRSGSTGAELTHLFAVFGIVTSGVHALGLGLVTAAVFVQRQQVAAPKA